MGRGEQDGFECQYLCYWDGLRMSKGVQKFYPRCGKCMKSQSIISHVQGDRPYYNLQVIGTTKSGEGIKMRCQRCGSTSTRYSKSAYRANDKLRR